MQNNWNGFWQNNTDSRFTRLSWSKQRIINVVNPYLDNGLVVLDAGSGSGFFSRFFTDQGCKTYSLDYSEKALDITRRQTDNRSEAYLCMDLMNKDFADGYSDTFDLVFTDGLFEHFTPSDQDQIFKHFKIVKKKSGVIVTFVPNKYSFWTLIRPLFMPGISEKPFRLNGLQTLYRRNECNIIESGGVNVLPIKYSPETVAGSKLGMLVYVIGR
jgi:SAM-dependent methyltransferase